MRYAFSMARFADLPRVSDALTPGERLREACDLSDAAIVMVQARLQREHPEATQDVIAGLVGAWLSTRPGAEHGDGVGTPVMWPRHPRS